MKKLVSRHTGVEFGYDETMAKNTRDYEIVIEEEKPKRKRRAKPKAKKVEDTPPVQEELNLDGLIDDVDDS